MPTAWMRAILTLDFVSEVANKPSQCVRGLGRRLRHLLEVIWPSGRLRPPPVPELPTKVLEEIIHHAILPNGFGSFDCRNPFTFSNTLGDGPEVRDDPASRASLLQVSKRFASITEDVAAGYVAVNSQRELRFFLNLFGPPSLPWRRLNLGMRTRRLDLKIAGHYNPLHIARLLELTPELSTLIIQNRQPIFLTQTPFDIIDALCSHGKGVRRLEFNSTTEVPTLDDIADIARALPRLETLRIASLTLPTFGPTGDVGHPVPFRELTTLSLGPSCWEALRPLLRWLSEETSQDPLPALRNVSLDYYRPSPGFFGRHGAKIQTMRVGPEVDDLPDALKHCPQLKSLDISLGPLAPTLAHGNGSIERVRIIPTRIACGRDDVALSLHKSLGVLDTWQGLKEIRIWDPESVLASCSPEMREWGAHFQRRGVSMVDNRGRLLYDGRQPTPGRNTT